MRLHGKEFPQPFMVAGDDGGDELYYPLEHGGMTVRIFRRIPDGHLVTETLTPTEIPANIRRAKDDEVSPAEAEYIWRHFVQGDPDGA